MGGAASGVIGQQQQMSVFQTQPLPEGSPLLDRSIRCSSSSSSSRVMSPAAGAAPNPTSSEVASGPGKQRATWQADSKAKAPAAAAAAAAPARAADKLAGVSRAPGSPKATKPKKALPDKPVTFHRQIKSSGYGFVQPKIKLGQVRAECQAQLGVQTTTLFVLFYLLETASLQR
jgi:hypothetical protein